LESKPEDFDGSNFKGVEAGIKALDEAKSANNKIDSSSFGCKIGPNMNQIFQTATRRAKENKCIAAVGYRRIRNGPCVADFCKNTYALRKPSGRAVSKDFWPKYDEAPDKTRYFVILASDDKYKDYKTNLERDKKIFDDIQQKIASDAVASPMEDDADAGANRLQYEMNIQNAQLLFTYPMCGLAHAVPLHLYYHLGHLDNANPDVSSVYSDVSSELFQNFQSMLQDMANISTERKVDTAILRELVDRGIQEGRIQTILDTRKLANESTKSHLGNTNQLKEQIKRIKDNQDISDMVINPSSISLYSKKRQRSSSEDPEASGSDPL
jgi:hypothetical protein